VVRVQKDKDDIEIKVGKNEEKCEKMMLKLKKKRFWFLTQHQICFASNLKTNRYLFRGISYILSVLDTAVY